MATINNTHNSNTLISGTSGKDSVYNEGSSNVTINTGDGNDYVWTSGNSVTINTDTGAGNDSVRNNNGSSVTINTGTGNDYVHNYGGSNVTINTGDGDDDVYNYCVDSVTINTGAGNDSVENNRGDSVTINTGTGNDSVYNESDSVTINTGAGNDSVYNEGDSVTINTGTGNDSVYNNDGYSVTINTGAGDDSVYNDYYSVTINTGAGNDSVYNQYGYSVTINTGAGNDSVYNYGHDVTINTGAGNDDIFNGCYLEADGSIYYYYDGYVKNVVFQYSSGDGNDIIYGFKADSTLQIGGTYSTKTSGDDIIVTVGKGKISLIGAASLSAVNIVSDENPATKWTLDGTTATYGDLVIKGVKSLDGISLNGSTVTISKASLGTSKVTISNGYTLALADDVSESTATQSWSLSGTKATYKQTTTAGYTLADNVITYTKKATKTLATVSGVKSIKGLSVDGKVVTVSKASLGTSKVTISDGYTLKLADDVDDATTKTAWSLSGTKATYKQTTTAGYALADNVIIYTKKATKTLTTVSGVKSTKGLSVDGKVVTVSKASLGTSKVTISKGYTLALADDVDDATTKKSWSLSNSTATYKQTKTAGYALANNAITYTKKSSKTLASVKGAKSKSGLSISGNVIKLKNSALNKKVTISGGYEFDFAADYSKATITGSKDSDTITTRGKNISINGGTGDDTIKIIGTGTITGGSGADVFVLKPNAANLISDYEQVDKISLTSGAANVTTSGNDIIFNDKITLSGAADKTVTYIAGGVEKTYENIPDDVIYNAKGTSATLTADYSGDSFTADSKLVTIDASPVMNQLKIIGNKKMNVIIGSGDDDYISGELGADTIQGGNGNDSLVGGAGNDCLIGGAGDDSLWGGSGTDTLIGGDGADIFIYKAGDGTIVIDDFDDSLDKIFVLSNKDKVENPIAYKSGNVTFEVGDGQIVVNGGADKYIPIYNAAKNILVKYNP